MGDEFKRGDRVRWKTSQGMTAGTVIEKLESETDIGGHRVAASKDHPEYLVESDTSGARAAHRPEALTKVDTDG